MRKITFPKTEKSAVKKQLKEEGKIVTTRVSKDFGRFKVGDRLEYAGFLVRVTDVKSFKDLDEHPFLSELESGAKKYIARHGEFDVVWLEVADREVVEMGDEE